MSLLNGIRFITRENRQNQSADGENGSKSHSKSKSHLKEYSKSTRNKHKSDHKHRDKKHLKSKSSHKSEKKNSNSILKKNKYDSSSGSDSGDVSSEEEVNMKEIAREEMEKERKHQMELLLQRNSLLNPPVVDIDAMPMSHIVHTKDVAGRDQTQTQVQKVNSNEKDQSTPPTVTNASVASLLRSKLKAGTQLKGSVATHLSDHSMLNTVYDTKMKKIEEALQEKDADVDDKSKNKMILNSTGYMSQDAQFNIGQMLKQEKYSSTGVNDAFIHNVMKMGTKYKDTGLKSNDSTREGDGEGIGDSDDDMERLSKKRKKSLLDFDNNSDSDENGGLDKHRHSHHNGISNHTNGYDSGDGDDIDMSLYVKKASISRTDRQTQEEKNWSIRKEASKIAHKSEYEQSISAKCRFCQLSNENSSSFLNHSHKLNVSQSPNVILKLKSKKDSLSKGHCEIIPRHHVCSYTLCDEDTRTEIDHYKESLIKYFEMQFNQGVVFIETAINLTSDRTHMVIDAIPQPKININDIPMYFKQVCIYGSNCI